jgi:teichuronic acid biosynthesis glycosyltransferase TuaC
MNVLVATAIYPSAENPAYGSFVRTQVEALRKAGVDVDVLVLNGRFRKLIYPKGVFQLRKRLSAGCTRQLIHAHISYVGMVVRTQFKLPVVVTYHGSDLLGAINRRGKKTPFSRLAVAAGQVLAQWVDAVIVQNEEMASKLNRKKGVYIIPCEVDFDLFRPHPREDARAALGLDPQRKYLLFAANPSVPVKRFPLAKQVADHLRQQDPEVELLVAHRETQDRLALLMSASDALVFPSYQEGSPNIIKQAMACNLPITATDVGDVRQIIGQTTGCYVCAPEVTDFAARLTEILSSRCRTNGREQVRQFSGTAMAQKLIRVYEEVLERRAS